MTRSSWGRVGAVLATAALGTLIITPAAHADRGPDTREGGHREGPVQFWGEGDDQCEVTFTIVNETNSTYYQIDYVIDDEELTMHNGLNMEVGRFNGHSIADQPTFPGASYVSDREPLTSTTTYNLNELAELPNAGADEHAVYYRMVLGPEKKHRGDGDWYRTTVTGCAEEGVEPDPECPGSGSLGSLFGSLHHLVPGHILGSAEGSMCGHHS